MSCFLLFVLLFCTTNFTVHVLPLLQSVLGRLGHAQLPSSPSDTYTIHTYTPLLQALQILYIPFLVLFYFFFFLFPYVCMS